MNLDDIKSKIKDVMYASDVKERIIEHYNGKYETGEPTHFAPLNGKFSWLRGDVTVFAGIANHGKSTFMMYLAALQSMYNGVKWAFFSPENNPPEYFYEELMFTYLQKMPHTSRCSEKEFKEAFDFVNDNFYFVYPEDEAPTPKLIHERFDQCHKDHGVIGFVTDPFNQLEHDMMRHQREDQYLSTYLRDVKKYALTKNGYYVIVVHPDKASVGRKKDSIDRECPDEYCLSGGAMWPNKVDNMIIVHRPVKYSAPESSEVMINIAKIKKFRIVGETGRVTCYFNKDVNRYEAQDKGNLLYGQFNDTNVSNNEAPF